MAIFSMANKMPYTAETNMPKCTPQTLNVFRNRPHQ
jgi:hypothetical protein